MISFSFSLFVAFCRMSRDEETHTAGAVYAGDPYYYY